MRGRHEVVGVVRAGHDDLAHVVVVAPAVSQPRVHEEVRLRHLLAAVGGARRPASAVLALALLVSVAVGMSVAFYVTISVTVSFLLYVCVFGGSSSGVIGQLHRALTGCYWLRRCCGRLCGGRCGRVFRWVEGQCCWKPNPLLQVRRHASHCCPAPPNTPRIVSARVC